MKKVMLGLFMSMIYLSLVSAAACDLSVSLINQDPYPAIQGDYVKLVFQVDGVENPECGTIEFALIEDYPISIDEGQQTTYTIESGVYDKDYSSFFLAPFKVRVSEDALDGDNPIEVQYKFGMNKDYETSQFNLNVEDTRADFEVYVKDYEATTRTITFEILNTAESDVEALTVKIPQQDNIEIKGANINIVGDLDSNEYTTADFEAIPSDGKIELEIIYTDTINERRSITKTIDFDSSYFEGRIADQSQRSAGSYIFYLVVIGAIAYYFYRRHKKKQKK